MNKLVKQLVESRFNFDIEDDIDNKEMFRLSK